MFPSWLGGLVIQWGGFTTAFNSTITDYSISWPIAFPRAVYVAQIQTVGGIDSGSGANMSIYSKNLSTGLVRAT
ncbi:gp53-like domain-containing protein, partial [Escherichia coli]|uniref:gp53-like domain-containing protein n=1 Tax=Escherichia coli TaxID=562 RepID=UPI003B43517D